MRSCCLRKHVALCATNWGACGAWHSALRALSTAAARRFFLLGIAKNLPYFRRT